MPINSDNIVGDASPAFRCQQVLHTRVAQREKVVRYGYFLSRPVPVPAHKDRRSFPSCHARRCWRADYSRHPSVPFAYKGRDGTPRKRSINAVGLGGKYFARGVIAAAVSHENTIATLLKADDAYEARCHAWT